IFHSYHHITWPASSQPQDPDQMPSDGATPTPESPRPRWWVDALWLLALAGWSAAWCLTAAPRLGVTYDEPFYLDSGLASWRGWDREERKSPGFAHEMATGHGVMPVPVDALSLPLYVHEQRTGERLV